MHATVMLLVFWAAAFLTLAFSLAALSIYFGYIGNDLELRSLGAEVAIAAVASLVEAGSVWLVATYVPTAGRALFIPAVIVVVTYKVCHVEDWNWGEAVMLLVFQSIVGLSVGAVLAGHYQVALIVLVVFGLFLALLANIIRGL